MAVSKKEAHDMAEEISSAISNVLNKYVDLDFLTPDDADEISECVEDSIVNIVNNMDFDSDGYDDDDDEFDDDDHNEWDDEDE